MTLGMGDSVLVNKQSQAILEVLDIGRDLPSWGTLVCTALIVQSGCLKSL